MATSKCYGYKTTSYGRVQLMREPVPFNSNLLLLRSAPANKTAPHPRRPRCGYVYKASPPFRIRHRFGGTPADGVGPGAGNWWWVRLLVFIGRRYGGARARFAAGFNASPGRAG